MHLAQALRLAGLPRVALVGAGGKSTAMYQLARQLSPPVIVTATTHLSRKQLQWADRHIVLMHSDEVNRLDLSEDVTVLTGPLAPGERTVGLEGETLERVKQYADQRGIPLILEADGSRMLPLKAPAAHEPVLPAWVDTVVVVVGLSAVGKPLAAGWVHRAEVFSQLAGLEPGEEITWEALGRMLTHPQGGLKNIPPGARRVALLNQADTPALQAQAQALAERLIPDYDMALVASLREAEERGQESAPGEGVVQAVYEPLAGVILAAGGSQRLGRPKQTLLWRGQPLVRHVAQTALKAGLSPVVVVTGAARAEVERAVEGLPVRLVHNPEWQAGQSSSLKIGLQELPPETGATFFLLADQPQVPPTLLWSMIETHRKSAAPLIAPQVEGRRANPVLFDRVTFPDLSGLSGDTGGRALFARYPVSWVLWNDASLLLDVDTPEDYQRLLQIQ